MPFSDIAIIQAGKVLGTNVYICCSYDGSGTYTLEATSVPITPDRDLSEAMQPQYHCLATSFGVTSDMRYGVHYPDKNYLRPGIRRAHAYTESVQYPCSEVVTSVRHDLCFLHSM